VIVGKKPNMQVKRGSKRNRTGWLENLDRAAGSGLLWVLVALALWATEVRSARRAGLRGLLNAAIAWALMGLLGRLFDHDTRPQAMAGAFATGAALESPLAGLATTALAASTVRSGHSSGAYGGVLGAGVALASRRLWPVPPDTGPEAPKVFLPAHTEASPEGDGLFVAVNTASGDGDSSPIGELRDALPQAKIEEIEIVEGDELQKAFDEASEHAVVLGISGGDGSVNTAAQVALDQEKALAVFPSGTLNHLASALGIERVEETVNAIRQGEAIGIDVATIDNHVFVNTASFGAYVELVDAREKLEKRIGKWPAVLVALIRMLRESEPVAVEIEGRKMKVWMAFIGNCRYSPSGFAPSWRNRLDDEQIDFRYVDGAAPWARLRLVTAVLTGRLASCKVYEQLIVKELRIRSLEGPLRLARDGETFESSSEEIVVRKLPERLAVYCPHDQIA
jgi:undecaprenyl-diphosphatase